MADLDLDYQQREPFIIPVWMMCAGRSSGPYLARLIWTPNLPDFEASILLRRVDGKPKDRERDLARADLALRFLSGLEVEGLRRKPGPKPGTGAKYPTREEWYAPLNEHIRPRPNRVTADENWFAERLGCDSPATLFKSMNKWSPPHVRDLREGNF